VLVVSFTLEIEAKIRESFLLIQLFRRVSFSAFYFLYKKTEEGRGRDEKREACEKLPFANIVIIRV